MFLSDFERKIYMAEKQNGMLDDLQVHVIHGRKESDITYLRNGSGLYLVNERAKNNLESMLAESVEFIPNTPKGLLKAAISQGMRYSYAYDAVGRLTEKKQAAGRCCRSSMTLMATSRARQT